MSQTTETLRQQHDLAAPAQSISGELSEVVFSESQAGYRRVRAALLSFFAMLAAVLVIVGAPPAAGGPWDTDVLLNGGWRIVNGQAPHTGFHSPVGPLTYALAAFGMKIAPPGTASITYGSIFLFCLLLPIAWYLASARFSWFIASVFVFFEGFYFITPRPPGYPVLFTSYAMIYNRQGYFLIALLCLCVFLRRRVESSNSDLIEGLVAGIILGLLLYCKITYFVAGAAIFAAGAILIRRPLRWFLGLFCAFSSVCLMFWALLHVSLYAYFRDFVTAGLAQSARMRISLLDQGLLTNSMWIYLLVFCLVLRSLGEMRAPSRRMVVPCLWLTVGLILATSLFLLSGNAAQNSGTDDPMYFLAAIVLLEFCRRRDLDGEIIRWDFRSQAIYSVSLMLLVPVFSLPILVREMASTGYAIGWDIVKRPDFEPWRKVHSEHLRDFYVPSIPRNTAYWPVTEFPQRLNDGIDLLRANLQNGDRVTTLGYTDPFSFALGIPPAKDGQLWWDLNISFNEAHHPAAPDFLGQATLVMVPRLADRSTGCCFATPDLMHELYDDYLHLHFKEIASTGTWILYRRDD
jgi:hypothetical protein